LITAFSQLTDVSWVARVSNPSSDAERDVAPRVLGAWGFPAPYGHKIDRVEAVNFNFDITCGTAQALCEATRNVCRASDAAYEVNLLFSFEGPGLAELTDALISQDEAERLAGLEES
jgi:hypothetical protein